MLEIANIMAKTFMILMFYVVFATEKEIIFFVILKSFKFCLLS